MAIIKCKMCGGDLNITGEETVAECEYCGSIQTIPTVDNEKKLTLFSRANRLRAGNEFDKAYSVYESIVAEFPEEAEAYWGLILCRFGIEYVDDPATGKKIPTCHRSSFDSVLDDHNFELVMECADVVARKVYRDQAKQIEELRKGIIEVSGKEAPYDIFICYKETAEDGNRTLDSVLAQDVYDALTEKGYRVFFSRITLEDKLGQEYEPYIFAALNSAKVMLAFGTDYEYFNAVWVKNEWSRYLKLMAQDKSKHLIPCYKGIDAYDMPKEFAKLQAQDMGKVGAVQDLLRGIEKLMPREEKQTVVQQVVQQVVSGGPNVQALLKRGNMALSDGDWDKANEFFDQVLNMDAECGEAYLGKALCDFSATSLDKLAADFSADPQDTYPETLQAGQPDEAREQALLEQYSVGAEYLETQQLKKMLYFDFDYASRSSGLEQNRQAALQNLRDNKNFQRALQYADIQLKQQLDATLATIDSSYTNAIADEEQKNAEEIQQILERYRKHLVDVEAQMAEQADRRVIARKEAALQNQKLKKVFIFASIATILVISIFLVATKVIIPGNQYRAAEALMAEGKYAEAIAAFKSIDSYKDSADRIPDVKYAQAESLLNEGKYEEAIAAFEAMNGYKDSADRVFDVKYAQAEALAQSGDFARAAIAYAKIGNYSDARTRSFALWDSIAQRDIISAGYNHIVGFKSDDTLTATGDNEFGQCEISNWSDIVAVSTGYRHTVGLKSDGTVVAVGNTQDGRCDVSNWSNVVAISAGGFHTIGLKSDGTVVAVGYNEDGQCKVSDWSNIIAISAGGWCTFGLKPGGTLVGVGA